MGRWFKKRNRVFLGGQRVAVKPLSMENAIKLILLLAPHLARLEEHWPQVKQALEMTDGTRPRALSALFTGLRDEMAKVPGDMVKAMALLLDRDQAEIAVQMTAQEFVDALPALDEVNDFHSLWRAAKELGMIARYRKREEDEPVRAS